MIKMLPYIGKDLPQGYNIEKFLKRTFEFFLTDEIERLSSTFFSKYRPENVFALNERAWVGVLNNAILKAFPENSWTLQEFSIYNSENAHKGRADLLVLWEYNGLKYNLLFEAKHQGKATIKHLFEDTGSSFEKIKEQAMGYYMEEIRYYNYKTFIVPIGFEWIRKPEVLSKAKKYFKQPDESTDFCYLYHDNNNGMWVYGKIYPMPYSIK
ncbi:MAG: hypothetical protein MUF36_00735 [Bacteroidales bacterium]|jgi:hypothetical protein|nr:hypothetical protein [Bacteroidales bacterium]